MIKAKNEQKKKWVKDSGKKAKCSNGPIKKPLSKSPQWSLLTRKWYVLHLFLALSKSPISSPPLLSKYPGNYQVFCMNIGQNPIHSYS